MFVLPNLIKLQNAIKNTTFCDIILIISGPMSHLFIGVHEQVSISPYIFWWQLFKKASPFFWLTICQCQNGLAFLSSGHKICSLIRTTSHTWSTTPRRRGRRPATSPVCPYPWRIPETHFHPHLWFSSVLQ